MDSFLTSSVTVLGAIALAIYVGQHTIRYRFNLYCDRKLGEMGDSAGSYAEGYRDALKAIQASIVRHKVVVLSVKREGEI